MSPNSLTDSISITHDFPGGNVIVDKIESDTISLRPDYRGTKGHWFYWYFEVNGAQGRTLTFDFGDEKTVGARGPAVSYDGGETWQWLNDSHLPEVEAFTFSFGKDQSSVRFAFCLPYTLADWKEYAETLPSVFEQNALSKTKQGREVPMVSHGLEDKENILVVIVGRQHACETSPSFAIEGFLDAWAEHLPEGLSPLATPLLDLDGVENGDQGKNRMPHDHNRDYNETHIYPETLALRKQLEAWPGKVLVLDMHSPYIREGDAETVYLVGSSKPEMAKNQEVFSRLLQREARGLPYHPSNNIPFGEKWNHKGNLKKGKSLARFSSELPNCIFATTLEIPYADAKGTEITQERLYDFGRSLFVTVKTYIAER